MLWRSCLAALVMGGSLACSAADDPGQPRTSGPVGGALGGQSGAGGDTTGAGGLAAGSGGLAGTGAAAGAGGDAAGAGGDTAGAGGITAGSGGLAGSGGAAGSDASSGAGGVAGAGGASGTSGAGGANTDSGGGDTGSVSLTGYNLVWSDEFNGPTLDTTAWTASDLAAPWNSELEYYSPNNVIFEDGALVLEAREESKGGRNYTSGKIDTQRKKTWTYGLFVARMKLPATVGMWPAFWMLGTSGGWPSCGELDVMEAKGRVADNIGGTAHYNEGGYKFSSGNYKFPAGQTIEGWHEYAIEWTSGQMKWSVDGNVFKTFDYGAPFNAPFFILLNLAVGGMFDGGKTPPANMTPQRVVVDYVRVYQKT